MAYCLLRLLCFFMLLVIIPGSAFAQANLAIVLQGVIENACDQNYWLGADFRFGHLVHFTLRNADGGYYVWSPDFAVRDALLDGPIYFARVSIEQGQVYFVDSYQIGGDAPPVDGKTYDQLHAEAFGPGAVSRTVDLPATCKPIILPDTPLKKYMLNGVLTSIEDEFSQDNKLHVANYAHHLRVIIYPFNVQDLTVYVVVPSIGELNEVVIHDEDYPAADALKIDGDYGVAQSVWDEDSQAIARARVEASGTSYWITLH